MVEEGHEIGSHTFSHPRMDQISRTRGALEHSMMRKLIAGYSGRDTRLYREPFLRAGGPIEEARVASLAAAQADGAIIAGMDIVPKDWLGMTADEIVDYVVSEVEKRRRQRAPVPRRRRRPDRNRQGAADRDRRTRSARLRVHLARRAARHHARRAHAGERQPWPGLDKVSFDVMSGTFDGLVTLFWVVLALGLTRSAIILPPGGQAPQDPADPQLRPAQGRLRRAGPQRGKRGRQLHQDAAQERLREFRE
jgi:peptidoglycan/xylan/chitin deacetylase (PgdA/CDA1 family)